jgi:hypothetical protein
MDQEEILTIAEKFQDECHATINSIMIEKDVSYQDATNVWMFKKLAELQHEINMLKKTQIGTGIKGEN